MPCKAETRGGGREVRGERREGAGEKRGGIGLLLDRWKGLGGVRRRDWKVWVLTESTVQQCSIREPGRESTQEVNVKRERM